jgi:Gas vesicle synthesis protein GvpL/GvpF
MATYLYCVRSDAARSPAGLTGVDGAAIHVIQAAGIAAWVSDVGEVPVAPTVDRLKQHDSVCAAALDTGETPLPIRFGQTFVDDAAAATAIVSRQATLRERLTRVSGCVELRIVVTRGREADVNEHAVPTEKSASRTTTGDGDGPGTA